MKFLREWEDRAQHRLDTRGQCFCGGDDSGGGGEAAEGVDPTTGDPNVATDVGQQGINSMASQNPQANEYDENSIGVGTSGRGGNVGGVNGPAGGVGVGGLGPNGIDQADQTYQDNPNAFSDANAALGMNYSDPHAGLMNEIADWASRNGIVSGTGAGQVGALGTQDQWGNALSNVMDYAPAVVSLMNPTLGMALGLANQLGKGNYENAGKSALGALASYYGGPVAGAAVNAAGQALGGNTQGAVTGALSSAINNSLGLTGPETALTSSMVGPAVSAIANNGPSADTGEAPGTTGEQGDQGTVSGNYTTGQNPEVAQMAAAANDPSSPDYVKNVVDALKSDASKATNYASNNPMSVLNGALQLYAAYQKQKAAANPARMGSSGGGSKTVEQQMADLRSNPQFRSFDVQTTPRTRVAVSGDLKHYGQGPQQQFFNNVNPAVSAVTRNYASGGAVQGALQLRTPHGLVVGNGGGQEDLVDAKLSPSEYVMDADTVSALGDGNPQEGARRLDAARMALRRHKRSAPPNSIPPKAKPPAAYFKGGRVK